MYPTDPPGPPHHAPPLPQQTASHALASLNPRVRSPPHAKIAYQPCVARALHRPLILLLSFPCVQILVSASLHVGRSIILPSNRSPTLLLPEGNRGNPNVRHRIEALRHTPLHRGQFRRLHPRLLFDASARNS